MTQNAYSEIKGYSLFTEVEDLEVQTYNRARTLKNIMLDNSKDRVMTESGKLLLVQYFEAVPNENRQAVHSKLRELLMQKEVV